MREIMSEIMSEIMNDISISDLKLIKKEYNKAVKCGLASFCFTLKDGSKNAMLTEYAKYILIYYESKLNIK